MTAGAGGDATAAPPRRHGLRCRPPAGTPARSPLPWRAMPSDHHRALGVRPEAGPEEIRAAYLRLMRANHPDHRPGDPAAAEAARRANVAYGALRGASRHAPGNGAQRVHCAGQARAEALRASARATRAYSEAQREYRAAFSRACLRVGLAVLAAGTAVLFALT